MTDPFADVLHPEGVCFECDMQREAIRARVRQQIRDRMLKAFGFPVRLDETMPRSVVRLLGDDGSGVECDLNTGEVRDV